MGKLKIVTIFLMFNAIIAAKSLNVADISDSEYVISVEHSIHVNYGCQYPITYKFKLDNVLENIQVLKKSGKEESWRAMTKKNGQEFYNGIELFRIDTSAKVAYVSASFPENSDSLFIKFQDGKGNPINTNYREITKYYDNRKAVVTASIDDCAHWFNPQFINCVEKFQKHKIWITMGIITESCDNKDTWGALQTLLDSGYTEACAHSQTHPHAPYGNNLEYEISGCKNAILENLDLPDMFSRNDKEYVYSWISPHGEHNQRIDSLLAEEKFLINRLYTSGYYGISEWDNEKQIFNPVNMSIEMGNTDWESSATTRIQKLNSCFDYAYKNKGVYHFMLHPQSVDWNKDYAHDHLEYISQRKDVWYVSMGHMYLYKLLSDHKYNQVATTEINKSDYVKTDKFKLYPNYPNPFNNSTVLEFQIKKPQKIKMSFYNIKGQLVDKIVRSYSMSGRHKIHWNASDLPSGIYIYKLESGKKTISRKLLLQK